jgi:hypothetical protein
MVLLSQMIRSQAIYGSTDAGWFQAIAGKQGGRWAEQHMKAAFPPPSSQPPQRPPAETRQALTDLQRRGVLNAAEVDQLRRRVGV